MVYTLVAVAALAALGPRGLAQSSMPPADAARAAGASWLLPMVRAGAVGSLLALIPGVSRTTFAMARDQHLPAPLARVHPRLAAPHVAELVVGAVVAVLAGVVDLRNAIGFSSFGVPAYYAVANAAAWTLRPAEGRPPRLVPALGLVGCLTLAQALPAGSVVAGIAVPAAGSGAYCGRRLIKSRKPFHDNIFQE